MTENNENKDMNKYLFVNLVTMLSMSAMQQLGKIINPGAGKAEISLDAAQATIDMLDMLSAKTKGNLDNDEARMMTDTLSMLKINFVETKEMKNASAVAQGAMADAERGMQKPQDKMPPEGPKDTEPEPQPQETKPKEEPPKFHKSYD